VFFSAFLRREEFLSSLCSGYHQMPDDFPISFPPPKNPQVCILSHFFFRDLLGEAFDPRFLRRFLNLSQLSQSSRFRAFPLLSPSFGPLARRSPLTLVRFCSLRLFPDSPEGRRPAKTDLGDSPFPSFLYSSYLLSPYPFVHSPSFPPSGIIFL